MFLSLKTTTSYHRESACASLMESIFAKNPGNTDK